MEGGRLDAQSPQVDVPLASVMDLVVDDVEQEVVNEPLVLAEGRYGLLKIFWRRLQDQAWGRA